jgi:hypothetical protein
MLSVGPNPWIYPPMLSVGPSLDLSVGPYPRTIQLAFRDRQNICHWAHPRSPPGLCSPTTAPTRLPKVLVLPTPLPVVTGAPTAAPTADNKCFAGTAGLIRIVTTYSGEKGEGEHILLTQYQYLSHTPLAHLSHTSHTPVSHISHTDISHTPFSSLFPHSCRSVSQSMQGPRQRLCVLVLRSFSLASARL